MSERDDPQQFLFTCEHCGFWPMAYQGPKPYGGDASFSCQRCKTVSSFRIKGAARVQLEALAR